MNMLQSRRSGITTSAHQRSHSRTLQRRPTKLRNQDIQQHQEDDDGEREHLAILPPHLSPHCPCTTTECGRLCSHGVSLVDEELDAFAAGEDLFDVFDHDVFDVVEFGLGARCLVDGRGGVVGVDEGGDSGGEGALEAVGGGGA